MSVRSEILFGRDFIVVDAVLLVEGVHAGSGGPLLYLGEDLKKSAHLWNGRPVVIHHPSDGLTAARPHTANQQQVGTVFNAQFQSGKLVAELWLEGERLQASVEGQEILTTINAGRTMEISTGLYTVNEPVDGVWNSKRYEYIARNHVPDHLAILPTTEGACSRQDGCGMNVNQMAIS